MIGGWRERYRAEKGDPAPGRVPRPRRLGIPPRPAGRRLGQLADGREFKDIDEFKQLLMRREDQVARNLTRNLLTYATGAGIQFADRDEVEAILGRLKAQGGGLRSLVHEIVQSPTFLNK